MNDRQASARRAFLRSACTHCIGLAALAGAPAWADALAQIKVPPRFIRPAPETDEGGLWAMMDREEMRLKRSPLTIRDKQLQAYLQDLVCRLAPEHCPDIRVHPVRVPHFNAMMAPNGMMIVWSGLLLRVENEAQLAAILGHEMGHYLERHQIQQMRAAESNALLTQMVGMVGGVGTFFGQIGLAASMFAYSREHEARADRMGVRLMVADGYDPHEAVKVWNNLLEEARVTEGKDAGKTGDIFDDHPATAERRDELQQLAAGHGGRTDEDRFRQAIAPLRFGWIQDEIKRGQYEESVILFDRMLRHDPQDVQVLYARGEVRRLRGDAGDGEPALADLQLAGTMQGAPPETFRSLGLLYRQRHDAAAAVRAFDTYLAQAPQAPDAALVRSYVKDLQP